MFVVQKIAPFFLIMLAGAALARGRILDEGHVTGLSRYVYWLGFPALLIHSLGDGEPPSAAVALGLVGYAAGALCPFLVAAAVARALRWPAPVSAALPMCAGLGDTGFLGLPLVVSLLGGRALGWAGSLVAIDWVLLASISGMALHRGAGEEASWLRALGRGLFTPIVAGAVIGVAQMMVGWRWPGPVDAAITSVSVSATATGLVALGAVLAARREPGRARVSAAPVWLAVGLKLVVGPGCVGAAVTLSGAPVAFRIAAMLMSACPTAVTVFIQARTAGVFSEGSARVVALSTLVSALSLTALATVLMR